MRIYIQLFTNFLKKSKPENRTVTETSALSPLQNILDHTLSRILEIPDTKTVLQEHAKEGGSGVFIVKTGFDGASSQSLYKQKYQDTDLNEAIKNEESLFQTAMVPLQLKLDDSTVWENKTPSSTHFCRPVNLQYKKETTELSKQEADRIRGGYRAFPRGC